MMNELRNNIATNKPLEQVRRERERDCAERKTHAHIHTCVKKKLRCTHVRKCISPLAQSTLLKELHVLLQERWNDDDDDDDDAVLYRSRVQAVALLFSFANMAVSVLLSSAFCWLLRLRFLVLLHAHTQLLLQITFLPTPRTWPR